MKCSHQIDGHAACGLLPLFSGEIPAQLADPGLAVVVSDMTRKKKQIAGAQKRHKSCNRRGEFWKCDFESFKLVVYGHRPLPAVELFWCKSNYDFGHSLPRHIKEAGQMYLTIRDVTS